MNKKVIVAMLAIMLTGAIGVYFFLGGFKPVEVTVEEARDYNLVGVKLTGKEYGDKLDGAFAKARSYILDGELDGVLTIVNYKDSTLADGYSNVFIGVKLNKGASEIPQEYGRLTIPARKVLRATLDMPESVRPTAGTVEGAIRDKALELNLDLFDFTIDQYINEQTILTDIPVKQ